MTGIGGDGEWRLVYARLMPGTRWGWLRLLAEGWRFAGDALAPMGGAHERHSVLMARAAPAALAAGGGA